MLFKDFGKLDDDHELNKNGIGLGLSICKKLVSKLGPYNEILLFSQESKGSTFTFYVYSNSQKRTLNKFNVSDA